MDLKNFLTCIVLCFSTSAAFANSIPFCNYDTPGFSQGRFKILSDGNVQDRYTNLIWRRCNLGESWDETTQQCEGLSPGDNWRDTLSAIKALNDEQYIIGKPYDWRLPNLKEMASLLNLQCYLFTIDENAFPSPRSAYWTSTPFNAVAPVPVYDENDNLIGFNDENMIWTISLLSGKENWAKWSSTNLHALLVRSESVAE